MLENKEFFTNNKILKKGGKVMNEIDTANTGRKYSPVDIGHEINNLLAIIQGNISIMLKDYPPPTRNNYERIKSIEEQIQRGAKLTSFLF